MLVDSRKIEIAMIVDASARMSGRRQEIIDYANRVIRAEHFRAARTSLSLIFFSETTLPIVASVPIQEMPELCTDDFFPQGGCAVHDAIGETISYVTRKLAETPAYGTAPGRVIIETLTQGKDTASHHYTAEEIKSRIMFHSANYGWEFHFPIEVLDEVHRHDDSQTA